MAVEDSVAQDQLRAFIERIERMEEEKAAIAADIKEIYAEAKGNGFDTKILRKIVTIRKQDANERMEQEALLEMYMSALGMVQAHEASLEAALRRGTNRHSAPLSFGRIEVITEHLPTKAAGQVGAAESRAVPSSVENEAAEISTPITEQQVAPQPASDLTSPLSPQGQVAPIQPETANEASDDSGHVAADAAGHGPVEADAETHPKGGEDVDAPDGPATPAFDSATNSTGTPGKPGGAQASSAPPTNISAFAGKPLRPHCLNPGNKCGGQGRNHCWSCTKAMNEAGAA